MECYCCLLRPAVKDLKTPYTRLGITEIYSDMIKECFEINAAHLDGEGQTEEQGELIHSNDGGCGICEVCIGRLRDASAFKLQVQRSQSELRERLKTELDLKDETKSETSECLPNNEENDVWDPTIDLKTENEIEMKTEVSFSPNVELEQHIAETASRDNSQTTPVADISPTHVGSDDDETCWKRDNQTCIEPDNSDNFPSKVSKASIKKNAPSRYYCELCNRHLTRSNLRRHMFFHTGKKPFTCGVCDMSFNNKSNMTRHELTHIKKKVHKCSVCEKKFGHVSLLKIHESSHKKKFCCELCGKRFEKKGILIIHLRTHTGEKPFSCDICKEQFATKNGIISHMSIHTGYPLSCKICAKQCANLSSLRRHGKIHKDDRPSYPCETCNKEFRYKHGLNAHRLIHTGAKPHVCDKCGKCFTYASTLKTHLLIHVEGQTYSCELCPKTYSTKACLRQHKRVHTKKGSKLRSS